MAIYDTNFASYNRNFYRKYQFFWCCNQVKVTVYYLVMLWSV